MQKSSFGTGSAFSPLPVPGRCLRFLCLRFCIIRPFLPLLLSPYILSCKRLPVFQNIQAAFPAQALFILLLPNLYQSLPAFLSASRYVFGTLPSRITSFPQTLWFFTRITAGYFPIYLRYPSLASIILSPANKTEGPAFPFSKKYQSILIFKLFRSVWGGCKNSTFSLYPAAL